MFKIYFVLCCLVSLSTNQEIGNRARLIDADLYFFELIQELVYQLEEREWCQFTLGDFNQTLNDITHTNIHLTGQVQYTNGFLISVQKIDLTGFQSFVNSRVIDNETVTFAGMRGVLNLRDARVGFDVAVKLTNEEQDHRYTGVFKYTVIQLQVELSKNMNTEEITVSTFVSSLSGGSGVRMVYMPDDDISQILSMGFSAASSWDSVGSWGRDVMVPIMTELATNKLSFPDYCFNC